MATKAQVAANRRNAEKSTGPRTAEGRAAVAQNTVKHGLSGRLDVIKGEDQAEFDRHREAMLAELAPAGAVESMLVERVVSLSWRLKRVERMQNEVFEVRLADEATLLARQARSTIPGKAAAEDGLDLGRAVIKDFANSRVLDRLLMYERRMEHSLFKTLNDLHLRRLRVREYVSRHMDEIGAEPVRSGPVRASGGISDLGFRIADWVPDVDQQSTITCETPDGVTTNIPDEAGVEEPACKTKPISPDLHAGQVPESEEFTEDLPYQSDAETNPISGGERDDNLCPAGCLEDESGHLCEESCVPVE